MVCELKMSADQSLLLPVVVIPIYKHHLNDYEWISLKSIVTKLIAHQVCILTTVSILKDVRRVLQFRLGAIAQAFIFHIVDDCWLASVGSYNHLMLSPFFYDFYQHFSHILLVQLDAYVFRDELLYWCSQPWDYIGAPIYLEGAPYGVDFCQCIGAGGFSLRRIDGFRSAFASNPVVYRWHHLKDRWKNFNARGKAFLLYRYLQLLVFAESHLLQESNGLFNLVGVNEDVVFGKYLPGEVSAFQVPSALIANAFAIDRFVSESLSSLGHLPFGTHAWWTNPANLKAWQAYIPELDS